jgi:hypothetical protein
MGFTNIEIINTGIYLKIHEGISPLSLIRPEGRIFLSPERSKVCFEAPETPFVPQNPCPCRELEPPSEVGRF